MQPWKLFDELFQVESMPYKVNDQWSIDHVQLRQLEQLELKQPENADKILVLLQQGDEILIIVKHNAIIGLQHHPH